MMRYQYVRASAMFSTWNRPVPESIIMDISALDILILVMS